MKVSVYENIYKTNEPKEVSVESILKRFKSEDKHGIAAMCDMSKSDYDAKKKSLPAVSFGGTFEKRSSKALKTSSGLLTLDIDNLSPDSLKSVKNKLKNFDSTYAVFKSPSGKGLKALIRIENVANDDEYKVYFDKLKRVFPSMDNSGKDISRLCFFCYDPELYINRDASVLSIEVKSTNKVNKKKNDYSLISRICNIIRHAEAGERHNKILKAARLAGGYIASGAFEYEEAFRILQNEADEIQEDTRDSEAAIRDGLKDGQNHPLDPKDLNTDLKGEEKLIELGKIYHRAEDVQMEIQDLFDNGNRKGYDTGHRDIDKHWSCLLGSTTYIYGAPYCGKTQWLFEVLICLSERHGLKHAILSPETGKAAQIFAEIIAMVAEKDFYKDYNKQMSIQEMWDAYDFVARHFIIVDPDDKIITYQDFYMYIDEIERVYETKVSTTTIDPWNELYHDLKGFGGRQDMYLEIALSQVRNNAQMNQRHNFLLTHVVDQKLVIDGNVRYYPIPTYREIAGGQAWSRKGMSMLSVWRPVKGLNNEHGEPFEVNETVIQCQKSKPKGVGSTGQFSMLYHANKHRYTDLYGNFASNKKQKEKRLEESKESIPYNGYDEEIGF